jgi:hypothetical protein
MVETASREGQQALLAQGDPFFFPSYVGSKVWIGVDLTPRAHRLDRIGRADHRQLPALVAPKKLAAQITMTAASTSPAG